MTSLDEVRSFWEDNPLWMGESSFAPGSIPFFEEHRGVCIADCFAGSFDPHLANGKNHAGGVVSIFGPEELQCVG